MNKVISFIKTETVLVISIVLAVISSFFGDTTDLLSFIDFKTLALLFCLMAVMAGFKECNIFSYAAEKLLKRTSTTRLVVLVLVLLCFFFSCLITNDVALITFVPFSITVLKFANKSSLIPITVILQTVAANMGSALTPIGNPQNIYIFSVSNLSLLDFIRLMIPYSVVTLIFLLCSVLFIKGEPINKKPNEISTPKLERTVFYFILFVLSILAVFGAVNYILCLLLVAISVLIFDKKIILKVDYSLLLTFVGFFIFVGNMGTLPAVKELIEELLFGREILFSALISQVISNVPAALMLSGFTDNMSALLVGVNIGGLGTLIASMASLISYKYVAAELPAKKGKYLLVFTLINFALLGVMLFLSLII
ncbi:MAG: anion permease [Clostridia bacterium]|nr:anion permease [Clostridia bacterium]